MIDPTVNELTSGSFPFQCGYFDISSEEIAREIKKRITEETDQEEHGGSRGVSMCSPFWAP